MKITMVIPSYWSRKKPEGWRLSDSVYDHPTPLDEEGTLGRALNSVADLKNKDFSLVILGVSTAEDIREEAESRIATIVTNSTPGVKTFLFSSSHLGMVHSYLTEHEKDQFIPLLQLKGYSNVRNLCLFAAHLLGSEAAVLIDDDEIFEDPQFMEKAQEFIGKEFEGDEVLAVAGYYINPDGDFLINKEASPWMTHWNKVDCMNRAFQEIIGKEPRLKETPFVFGGNAVIHRKLFMSVAFDPAITRGEDIDFLINARMFGFKFLLDNQLAIKHKAPPKPHPEWRKVREDIFRFVYEKRKLDTQEPVPGMTKVTADELGVYPGEFLKDDLEERIFRSNLMLAADYLIKGEPEGAAECLNNIHLARTPPFSDMNPFQNLIRLQKEWKDLMEFFSSEKVCKDLCSQLGYPHG